MQESQGMIQRVTQWAQCIFSEGLTDKRKLFRGAHMLSNMCVLQGLWYLLEKQQRTSVKILEWVERKGEKLNHWITGCFKSEKTSGNLPKSEYSHLQQVVQDCVQSCFEFLHTTMFLGNLFQCSTILTVNNSLLTFRQNSMSLSLCRLFLGFSERTLSLSSSFPWASFLQAEQCQSSLPLLIWKMLRFLSPLCGLSLDSLH